MDLVQQKKPMNASGTPSIPIAAIRGMVTGGYLELSLRNIRNNKALKEQGSISREAMYIITEWIERLYTKPQVHFNFVDLAVSLGFIFRILL